jgi:hypothetical protein
MSTDPEQEDFTEGLVEDITTTLSGFEDDDAAAAGVRPPRGTGRSGIGMVQGGLDAVVGFVAGEERRLWEAAHMAGGVRPSRRLA